MLVMNFLYIMIVFCVCVLVAVATALILSIRKKGRGISKDFAEQAVLRRVKNGHTIGARFTKQERGFVWEFDISDGARVYRVWVDAHTGVLFKAIDLGRGSGPPAPAGRMLGQKIG